MTDPGLRARKKARTRAELQRHALRLFRDRGFAATTADDIAAAADVSRSTFFRYFPTKEDVVLLDDVDPLYDAAFRAQPAGTPLLRALARSMRTAFASLDDEKRALEEVRMDLARTVPEIGAVLRERNTFGVDAVAALVGEAVGRPADDDDVVVFAGVVSGARLAAQALVRRDPDRAYIETFADVLEVLADGVPLADAPIVT
ncbi:TetR family transcriptional regulator [Actinomycetospora succinea]|uniref:TetR family transcriptional regulator n=1 Tax=Actinomycetospora succinea TaxID=663603 RepID=UPI001FB642EF|nr:TetR family transcriptional regulator [Actinomycetospora succinea]